MITTIKPIETNFRGHKFRSRLEARWAVFFDCIGINWMYEYEGFELAPVKKEDEIYMGKQIEGQLFYLPDFLIPSQNLFPEDTYFEVKPTQNLTLEESNKASRLAYHSEIRCCILSSIPNPQHRDELFDLCRLEFQTFYPSGWDTQQCFCQCPVCGRFGFAYEGRAARIKCGCDHNGKEKSNATSPELMRAYHIARTIRFEDFK